MKLKVYVGEFGRLTLCEKFPDDEKHAGLNELLKELVNENFHGDEYKEAVGF